jgi:hypothetical protein
MYVTFPWWVGPGIIRGVAHMAMLLMRAILAEWHNLQHRPLFGAVWASGTHYSGGVLCFLHVADIFWPNTGGVVFCSVLLPYFLL